MASHTELGREGERRAGLFLQSRGFSIIESNWRYGHWEIDLVATRDGILHFIEVKTKRSARGGLPENRVNRKKFRLLQQAASAYLEAHPHWVRIQFDIVAILIPVGGHRGSVLLIEDVFFWD